METHGYLSQNTQLHKSSVVQFVTLSVLTLKYQMYIWYMDFGDLYTTHIIKNKIK